MASDKTEVHYKNWKIIFDNYTYYTTSGGNSYQQDYTRVRTLLTSPDDIQFEIYRNNVFSFINKLFGAQDLKIDVPDFDKKYIIKSNYPFKTKSLLSDNKIRNQIEQIPKLNLVISNTEGIWEKKLTDNNYELAFFTEGKVEDTILLKKVYGLIVLIIDRLDEINAINPL